MTRSIALERHLSFRGVLKLLIRSSFAAGCDPNEGTGDRLAGGKGGKAGCHGKPGRGGPGGDGGKQEMSCARIDDSLIYLAIALLNPVDREVILVHR